MGLIYCFYDQLESWTELQFDPILAILKTTKTRESTQLLNPFFVDCFRQTIRAYMSHSRSTTRLCTLIHP